MLGRKRKFGSQDVTTCRNNAKSESSDPLDGMLAMLKCSGCQSLPQDRKVWIPGNCTHKYCKSCIQDASRDSCLVCSKRINRKDQTVDNFSTNLLKELLQLQEIVTTEASEMKENVKKVEDVLEDIDAPELEKADLNDESVGGEDTNNRRVTLSQLFASNEEDEDEHELDPDLPALTPHPPSAEKTQRRSQIGSEKSEKVATVLLERLDMEKESSKLKTRKGSKKSIEVQPSDDEESNVGTPRTSRRSSARRPKVEEKAREEEDAEGKKAKAKKIFQTKDTRKEKSLDSSDDEESNVGTPRASRRSSARRPQPEEKTLEEEDAKGKKAKVKKNFQTKDTRKEKSLDSSDDEESNVVTPRASRRSSARRPQPEEKTLEEEDAKGKKAKVKKFFQNKGTRKDSRDSSLNSGGSSLSRSASKDAGKNQSETEESASAVGQYEQMEVDAVSPAKSDIYEFKSQSTKPKPKARKQQKQQQRRSRKDSESSTDRSSIHASPQPKNQEFVKPASRSSSNSNVSSSKGVKASPSTSNVNKRNAKGETPLLIAVRNGKLEKVKDLLEAGADINAKDHAGWTALHEAICAKTPSLEMVKFLVTSGADVHALGLKNSTPLHEASRLGLKAIVKYLLAESASPALRNLEGKLPVDVAKDDTTRKVFTEWEKKSVNQSQSTQISVQLRVGLENAIFFFAYTPDKGFLRNCQQLLGIKVSNELKKEVTHVVFDAPPKSKVPLSFNYVVAVLNGCWMLSNKWLEDSVEVGRFLDPTKFQIGGCQYENIPSSNGSTCDSAAERARINRELGNPSLFDGFNFYIYKNSSWTINDETAASKEEKKKGKKPAVLSDRLISFNKKDMAKIIAFGNGTVINREPDPEMVDPMDFPQRFHAAQPQQQLSKSPHKLCLTSHVILYDDKNVPPNKYDMEHVKTMKTDWLIHAAVHFKLLMPDSYLE